MNDLKEACNTFFPILYADDTGLVSSLCSFIRDEDVSNTCEISRNINDELYCVQEWLNVNRLSLNGSKTNMIFHHRQRKIDEFIPDIRINDSPIERVTDFNFLGLQIDQHLNWNAHIFKNVPIKYLVLWESWIVLNAIYQQKSSVFYTIL